MIESSDFRTTRMPLNHGAGHIPVLGFGTLIPDAAATISATRDALEAGFRHFDCAERYRNEREVGEALQAGLAAGRIARASCRTTASSLASYSYDGTVRAWRARDAVMTRRFADHGSVVEDADYIEHGRRIVVEDVVRLVRMAGEERHRQQHQGHQRQHQVGIGLLAQSHGVGTVMTPAASIVQFET